MQRFRKRSDARKSPTFSYSDLSADFLADLPELPPLSDFRTSLILPDLSRRFTILRASTGDTLVDALKSRLAYQRETGAENQIPEEDEDMILDTLGLRSKIWSSSSPEKSEESIPDSNRSTSSPRKRYSNNLFGSGKFRDYTYIRSARASKLSSTAESTKSDDHTDAPSPDPVRSAPLIPPAPYGEQSLVGAEYRLSKTMGPTALRHASIALEEAIRELEEEAEDKIVMPRSAPTSRLSFDDAEPEPGTAISSDKQFRTELEERRVSPIPSRTVPGYIPGMPRPMTPRENIEAEEQRSHSTTPRATSPMSTDSSIPPSLVSSLMRRDSANSPRYSPRSMSPPAPMFIQRSTNNGRQTPEEASRNGELASDFEFPPGSSVIGRRRPASPLSGPSYRPMTVSPVSSRPTTPSNVYNQKPSFEHNHSSSWISDTSELSTDQSKAAARSNMKSPALPDSPVIDRSHATIMSFTSTQSSSSFEHRSPSSMSGSQDLGFPAFSAQKPVRSPTPTQQRSPTSPTFTVDTSPTAGSRRSSQQNGLSTISPFLPIMLSPIASSSHSSLDSIGSSYHSWEGEKDRTYSLFSDTDTTQPSWHEISISEQSSSTTPGGSPGDEWDAEDVINKYAGLKKSDFMAIQGKLVSVATTKTSPERNSSLRRRRPSTSQSNYSISGIKMQSPQSAPVLGNVASPADQYVMSSVQAQNALLNAMVDSIQSPKVSPSPPSLSEPKSSPAPDMSPNSRRTRDLAQILFGQEHPAEENVTVIQSTVDSVSTPLSPKSPYSASMGNLSSKILTPQDQAELAREVQRKTEAAMAILKKQPSTTNLTDGNTGSGSIRKRISPNQISTPTLVSASTSVDTIPLRPSSSSGGQPSASKLGSRFRKLRGTLRRSNAALTGEEVTPYPLDLRSPPASGQTLRYNPENIPGTTPPASATEPGRFKVPVPSPPASAGPGLKGFMARFRGSKQPQRPETFSESGGRGSPLSPVSPPQLSLTDHLTQPQPARTTQNAPSIVGQISPISPSQQLSAPPTAVSVPADESLALKQLFDAASNLGLDQKKLNDLLLVRSGSTSSKPADWNTSPTTPASESGEGSGSQSPNVDSPTRNAPARKPSARRPTERKPREGADVNPVVRRTILLPTDSTVDLTALMKKTSIRRRRTSANSMSSRSVHDRVPTPPPRSPTSRRFSAEPSPPVPQLPRSFASQGENMLGVPPLVPLEKSNSQYDSLYDMYTEDVKMPATPTKEASPGNAPPESGPALEVLELANGEVIWNIVNGLRDEDSESLYAGRTSFSSEYEPDEAVKVYFREHTRNTSKGSASSIISRKRPAAGPRPETQVYMTPSAQIGRLIEDLSQGLEAGSFNFSGANGVTHGTGHGLGHSTTSSMSENDMHWSVEERLEHMLGAMRKHDL